MPAIAVRRRSYPRPMIAIRDAPEAKPLETWVKPIRERDVTALHHQRKFQMRMGPIAL